MKSQIQINIIHLHLREEMDVTGVFFGVRISLSPLENVHYRGGEFRGSSAAWTIL